MGPSGVAGRLRAASSPSTRRSASGRSPPCCPTRPRTRCSAATAGSWRATTTTPSSSWPGSRPCAASLARRRAPGVPSVDVEDDQLVTAEAIGDGRRSRAASRRTPTTGSASAASRWTPPSAAGARAGCHGRAARVGRRARRDRRRTSRCSATTHRALALYDGLGFAEHHRYRYLAAPAITFPSGTRVAVALAAAGVRPDNPRRAAADQEAGSLPGEGVVAPRPCPRPHLQGFPLTWRSTDEQSTPHASPASSRTPSPASPSGCRAGCTAAASSRR